MKISPEVAQVLATHVVVTDNQVTITAMLDRKMYVAVNAVLEAAGGTWNRSRKAHVFSKPAQPIIDQLLSDEEITTHKDIDFFETPIGVINAMMEFARPWVKPNAQALEPSAGRGAIAIEMQRAGFKVQCVEKHKPFADDLAKRYPTINDDFLSVHPRQLVNGVVDLVLMNPPFSNQDDMRHVLHALRFVKYGGAVIAVMSPSFQFRESSVAKEFRKVFEKYSGKRYPLPDGTFKEAGTMVRTVVVHLVRE